MQLNTVVHFTYQLYRNTGNIRHISKFQNSSSNRYNESRLYICIRNIMYAIDKIKELSLLRRLCSSGLVLKWLTLFS